MRVARLPTGPPPQVDYLADGVLRYDGRTISTDFPADAVGPEILGAVDGHVVIDAYVDGVADPGEWFFVIDDSGHAQRLGGSYEVYDHSPRLVEQTGHIWIDYDDRGTGRSTIWVLDARSGGQVAAYHDQHEPSGLAAADQAAYDAFTGSARDLPATSARSPDGTLTVDTRPVRLRGGSFADRVLVRRAADGTEVARFVFPKGIHGADGVERVVFEDDRHVLVLVRISDASPRGGEHTIVRCDVASRSCRRAVDIGGNMALGLSPPAFQPG